MASDDSGEDYGNDCDACGSRTGQRVDASTNSKSQRATHSENASGPWSRRWQKC